MTIVSLVFCAASAIVAALCAPARRADGRAAATPDPRVGLKAGAARRRRRRARNIELLANLPKPRVLRSEEPGRRAEPAEAATTSRRRPTTRRPSRTRADADRRPPQTAAQSGGRRGAGRAPGVAAG